MVTKAAAPSQYSWLVSGICVCVVKYSESSEQDGFALVQYQRIEFSRFIIKEILESAPFEFHPFLSQSVSFGPPEGSHMYIQWAKGAKNKHVSFPRRSQPVYIYLQAVGGHNRTSKWATFLVNILSNLFQIESEKMTSNRLLN